MCVCVCVPDCVCVCLIVCVCVCVCVKVGGGEDLGVLRDCGDGVTPGVRIKCSVSSASSSVVPEIHVSI